MSRGIRCNQCGAFRHDGTQSPGRWFELTEIGDKPNTTRHFCSMQHLAAFAVELAAPFPSRLETPALLLEGTGPLPLERKGEL